MNKRKGMTHCFTEKRYNWTDGITRMGNKSLKYEWANEEE
jgi:hypothetical protein